MKTISLRVTEERHIPFIVKLLSHFDFVEIIEGNPLEESEDAALVNAIEEGLQTPQLDEEAAIRYLEEDED